METETTSRLRRLPAAEVNALFPLRYTELLHPMGEDPGDQWLAVITVSSDGDAQIFVECNGIIQDIFPMTVAEQAIGHWNDAMEAYYQGIDPQEFHANQEA